MNFEKLDNKENIKVYSDRIGEILICEFGLKELINIFYLPARDKKSIDKKAYIFRNSPALLKVFKEYTFNPNYISNESKEGGNK